MLNDLTNDELINHKSITFSQNNHKSYLDN
nr:MAG TPA: hypothetical protein [Caudoviricetes sp.]